MLTRTELFEPAGRWLADRPLRKIRAANVRSIRPPQHPLRPSEWLRLHAGRVLCQPYSVATWLAMLAVAIYRPVLVSVPGVQPGWSYWPVGYLVSVMAVNGTAMLWVLIIRKSLGKE